MRRSTIKIFLFLLSIRQTQHTVKENAEALVVATKEIGLEVNADKTKYMVMSGEQTAGLSHRKGGRVQIFGNDVNKLKFYSERN